MTKIYLVCSYECKSNGLAIASTEKVYTVFTNRKLANKAVDYMNKDWKNAFHEKDFSKVQWYAIKIFPISKVDYSKLSF